MLFNFVYLTAYAVMLPMILWRRVVHGRSLGDPWQRVFGRCPPLPRDGVPVVWLHAVSVGEVNQLGALLEHMRQLHPEWRYVISTTTATGMKLANERFPDLHRFWFPIDFTWSMAAVMRRVRPALIVLTELELWPNLMAAARRREIPVAVVNGRLGERSARGYRRLAWLSRPMFASLAKVVTQDDDNAGRFRALGVAADRVHITDSLKFDNARRDAAAANETRRADREHLRQMIDLRNGLRLLVAGSTQEPEESMVARVYRDLSTTISCLRLVVVPRHPHRAAEIQQQLEQLGLQVQRRTTIGEGERLSSPNAQPPAVLVVDTIGELGLWWSLADIAFVGGSFGNRGGQNMLEPAAAGCATCFGPNTWNFSGIVREMKSAAAAVEVADEAQLRQFIEQFAADERQRGQLGQRARQFVAERCGATERTARILIELVSSRTTSSDRTAA